VCDLTAVEFLGASGLAVLVGLGALAADTGVGLRLVADDRNALRLLRLVGLDRTLCVEADLHAAITHALRRRR
jgi:anti-anti-sigma factor